MVMIHTDKTFSFKNKIIFDKPETAAIRLAKTKTPLSETNIFPLFCGELRVYFWPNQHWWLLE